MFSLLIFVPLFIVMLINMPFGGIRKSAYILAFLLALAQIVFTLLAFFTPLSPLSSGRQDILGNFFNFRIGVDNLTLVLLFCIGLTLLVTLLTGREVVVDQRQRFNFVNLLVIAMAGLNGIVLAQDIFTMYVFLEIAAVASYILISFQKGILALEAAFKYLILSAAASVLMLSAIALLVLVSGDTSFAIISQALRDGSGGFPVKLALGLFVCGFAIKGGIIPFHGWLPDAYTEAPAPVSIFLAGIVTKTLGLYTLIRVVTVLFGQAAYISQILLVMGILSVVFGAWMALTQNDFKRMLAYSSISQVGYIILGLACGPGWGLAGAILHILNHTVFKSLLFVNSAAVETKTGTRNMDQLAGLSDRMPVTSFTSIIASLSAAGVPPLAGFWSKLLIIIGLWQAGFKLVAVIAVLASIITLGYLLSIQRRVFWGKLGSELLNVKEAKGGIMISAVLLAAIAIGVGLAFPFIPAAMLNSLSSLLGG